MFVILAARPFEIPFLRPTSRIFGIPLGSNHSARICSNNGRAATRLLHVRIPGARGAADAADEHLMWSAGPGRNVGVADWIRG
jgi:hypothetical protein